MDSLLTKLTVLVIKLKEEIFKKVYTKNETDIKLQENKNSIKNDVETSVDNKLVKYDETINTKLTEYNESMDNKLTKYDESIDTKVHESITTELETKDVVTNEILSSKGYTTSSDVAKTYATKTDLHGYVSNNDVDIIKTEITESVTQDVESNIDSVIDNKITESIAQFNTVISDKVDKDGDKVLSDRNYTEADQTKLHNLSLDGLASEEYVQNLVGSIQGSLTSEQLAKLDLIVSNGDGSKALFNDGTYKDINISTGTGLTEEQLAKVNVILTNGQGKKVLYDDGIYRTIEIPEGSGLTDEQATKISKLTITEDGTKVLFNDGTYKVIDATGLSQEQITKLNTITTDGSGTNVLHDDGTYKLLKIPDGVTVEQSTKISKLKIDGNGLQALYDNGKYGDIPKEISDTDRKKINTIVIEKDSPIVKFLTNAGTYTEFSLKKADQDKIDILVTNGRGNFFLADNGTYIEMHATFTEEEYVKLKAVTNGVTFVDPEVSDSGPSEELYFSNDGTWKKPYITMTKEEVNEMVKGLTGGSVKP